MNLELNDWLQVFAVVSGLLGSWLVIQQRIDAFYWWLGSNVALIVIQWMSGNRWLIVLYIAYSVMNIYGIRKWTAEAKARTARTATLPVEVPGAGA